MGSRDLWTLLDGIEPLDGWIPEWPPHVACEMFMRRYRELTA